jgi:hypothetical protein
MVLRVRDRVLYKLYKVLLTYIIYTHGLLSSFPYIPSYPFEIGGAVYYLYYVNSLSNIIILPPLEFRLVEEVLGLLNVLSLIRQ